MIIKPRLAIIGLGKYYHKLKVGIDQHFLPVLAVDLADVINAGGDLHRLVAPSRPDAIMLLTPNSLHADQTLELANIGVPILVEKPLATTISQLDLLLDAVKINPLIYCSDFYADVRATPLLAWAKRPYPNCMNKWMKIESDPANLWERSLAALGLITLAEAALLEGEGDAGSFDGREWLWDPIHGGVLWDLAYHHLVLWHFLLAEPLSIIECKLTTTTLATDLRHAETHAELLLRPSSIKMFGIRAGKYHRGKNERWFLLKGTEGYATMFFQDPNFLKIGRDREECTVSVQGNYYSHVSEVFREYVLSEQAQPHGLDAAIQAVHLVSKAKRTLFKPE